MARQELVSYVVTCDVCGDAILESDSGDVSRKIGFEGSEYAVDLCGLHQGELDDALKELKAFVDAGQRRPAGRRGRTGPVTKAPKSRSARTPRAEATSAASQAVSRSDIAAIRTWAQANGYKVGDRGRIPASVVAAYGAQDGASASPTESVVDEVAAAPVPAKRRPRKSKVATVTQ